MREVNGVAFASRGFSEQPVRQPAISYLAVVPRTDADPHVQPLSGAEFQKPPQIALTRPVELPLHFFVVNPGKTVMRSGFGTNFFRDEGVTAGFTLVENPPLQVFNYFSPYGGLYLNQLAGYSQSTAFPWLNVAVASDDQMPRTYSYNFTVQQQVPGNTLVSLAYVGNRSNHLVGWPRYQPRAAGRRNRRGVAGDHGRNNIALPPTAAPTTNVAGIDPAAHILKSNYNAFRLTAARAKGRINYWVS